MTELDFHRWAVWSQLIIAAITFLTVIFVAAPYGRYERSGWGWRVEKKRGWILMEFPAVAVFLALFLIGEKRLELIPLVFLGIWQIHYIHRAFIFPHRMRFSSRTIPLLVPVLGIAFNTLNAYINARWLTHFGDYESEWLYDPRFLLGLTVFVVGWLGNLDSDNKLRSLRKSGDTSYKIPKGGLYRWISAPNYGCEILMWIGWAIATWSTPGLAFALYSAANLAPRALNHHSWYRKNFDEYPTERKALIPYIL